MGKKNCLNDLVLFIFYILQTLQLDGAILGDKKLKRTSFEHYPITTTTP